VEGLTGIVRESTGIDRARLTINAIFVDNLDTLIHRMFPQPVPGPSRGGKIPSARFHLVQTRRNLHKQSGGDGVYIALVAVGGPVHAVFEITFVGDNVRSFDTAHVRCDTRLHDHGGALNPFPQPLRFLQEFGVAVGFISVEAGEGPP